MLFFPFYSLLMCMFLTFLNNALNKRTQEIWGNGTGTRCYIYVKDVVHSITSVIERKETGPFNILLPKAITHLDLAETNASSRVFATTKSFSSDP